MLELNELRQLVVFAECGTLTEAAQKLHLSQPALTRNMKKLEEELGVPLFIRRRNHLELNETGKFALKLAQKLMQDADALVERTRIFDRHSKTLTIGLCAPAPRLKLTPILTELFPEKAQSYELCDEDLLLRKLQDHSYSLIVTTTPPDEASVRGIRFERERLMVSFPKSHRLAGRESICFSDIDGETMLELLDIGFWCKIDRKMMPNSRFITQSSSNDFSDLVNASSLLSFTSDLMVKHYGTLGDRVDIPITDPEAFATYYLVCREEDADTFAQLFVTAGI